MKKNLILAAIFAVTTLASCNRGVDGGDDPVDGIKKPVTLTIKTSTVSKSIGAAAAEGQKAAFDPSKVSIVVKKDDATFDTLHNVVLSQFSDPGIYEKYTATVDVAPNATHVYALMNADGETAVEAGTSVTLSDVANTRQGLVNQFAVQIDRSVDLSASNGEIKLNGAGQAEATVTVGPEMARIEMINDLLTDGKWATLLATNMVGVVDTDGDGVGNAGDGDMTYADVLAHYDELRIEAFYLDNVKAKRGDAAITDYNDDFNDTGWPELWLNSFLDEDSSIPGYVKGASSNYGDTPGAFTILNNSTTATEFAGIFNNSVGYNVFPTAAPTGTGDALIADAKDNKHPHFVIAVSYFPSQGTGATKPFAPTAFSKTRITRYINLAAYVADGTADGLVTFSAGKLYQFNLSNVLAFLLDIKTDGVNPEDPDKDPIDPGDPIDPVNPPTEDPDDINRNVQMSVQVLDWQVEPVTPLPL